MDTLEKRLYIFGKRLKELRKSMGWSQQNLADKLGCSKSSISFYENAKKEARFTVILQLAQIFDVEPGYLMGETSVKKLKKIAT